MNRKMETDWPIVSLPQIDWGQVASLEQRSERIHDIINHLTHLMQGFNDRLACERKIVRKY